VGRYTDTGNKLIRRGASTDLPSVVTLIPPQARLCVRSARPTQFGLDDGLGIWNAVCLRDVVILRRESGFIFRSFAATT
jgi:hypothetical protein